MRMQSDGVNWFVGVVEDRLDPMQQGRVRVRVVGVHPFSRIQGDVAGIPVEELPWMSVCLPVTSASVSGISGAVTGLVNGSSVFGIWLDKYKTNGLVLGSYSGNQVNIPNSEEGFSDPFGQYPNNAGPDTSGLNAGGAYGDSSGANGIQNGNSSTGILPGGKDVAGEDNNPALTIETMLRGDEGVKNQVYWDSLGYPTVGIGHLIVYKKTRDMNQILPILSRQLGKTVGSSINASDISTLFKMDLQKVQSEIRKNGVIAPVYAKMNRSRQMALENMAFQMGTGGLAKFRRVLGFMGAGQYAEAAAAAKQSKWARQTPGRANRISLIIKNGNVGSYGVLPPKPAGKMMLRSNFSEMPFMDGFNPYDPNDQEVVPDYTKIPILDGMPEDLSEPFVEEETAVLFSEPKSSYRGEYPYVKATRSEGGHVVEYDDTPGQERHRQMHPSGSYTEDAADGRKTDKATGDRYFLTGGSRHDLCEGEYKVNVGGVETYINFSDAIQQVEGNRTSKIAGNETIEIAGNEIKKITGDGTIEVSGNIKIVVAGNASIDVSGNTELKVGGSMNANVSGSYTMNVGGTYSVTSGAVTWNTPRFDVV